MQTLSKSLSQLISPTSQTETSTYHFAPEDFRPELKTRLLILQPTPFCNISCDYCYLSDRDSTARMSLRTVRLAALRLREDGLAGESLTVVWHAGEPLAVPISFYEEAIATIREVLGHTTHVSHAIQTNATLINDHWCSFFKNHEIRVGVSIDGPAHLHNLNRHTRLGKPTHHLVMRGIETLKAYQIPFHAIAVVTAATLREPDSFFDFFLQHGIHDIGCNFDEAEGNHTLSSLTGKEVDYCNFLARLHERSQASGRAVRIRELEYARRLITADLPNYQWRNEIWPENHQIIPFAFITVAWNGNFSTFSPELLGQKSHQYNNFVLGNVLQESFLTISQSKAFRRMWSAILHGMYSCQQSCAYFKYCGAGSPVNKLSETKTLSSTETLYCRATIKHPLCTALNTIEKAL